MDDTPTIQVGRTGPAPMARIGLVGAAAAALVAIGILAAGATAAPSGTLAAGADAGATTIAGELLTLDGGKRGFGEMHGFGGITITAISGSSISLETKDGWTRTITVDSGTTYSKSGASISLSDLAVGDQIQFDQTLESNGSYSIDSIAVILPSVGGTVTAISGSTITIQQRDGTSATVKVTADTTYEVAGTSGKALTDISVGMLLVAEGTQSSDGSLTAAAVRAFDPSSTPEPGDHGFRGPDGPHGDDTTPDATTAPDSTSGSAG
ncbi:MAG: hypothetical protein C0498_08755 [Anaerolinea sp.]|nr:hypothetical protein [Anaerolinea sp.]